MKIVDRQTFLGMPSGTVFFKFGRPTPDPGRLNLTYEECLFIKEETCGRDFFVQDISLSSLEGVNDSSEWVEKIEATLAGAEAPPLDFNCVIRDGLFDEGQLFAVLNQQDVEALISRLQTALTDGYSRT